jgi:flagellar biosynthesis/type III secretory pathway chaperone
MKLPPQLNEREVGAVAVCRVVLDRLCRLLDEESAALVNRTVSRHGPFTERKNQLLRELMMAQRNCATPSALLAIRPQASAVREALLRNQQLLTFHIDAVREVSAIIVDTIRQSESDGTYSRYA